MRIFLFFVNQKSVILEGFVFLKVIFSFLFTRFSFPSLDLDIINSKSLQLFNGFILDPSSLKLLFPKKKVIIFVLHLIQIPIILYHMHSPTHPSSA